MNKHLEDFRNFATHHMGVSGMQLHYWDKIQDYLYGNSQVVASVTPMIVEEREMRAIQMSVFDRLMMDRIIWLVGPVHDGMSTVVQAQLMWLDQQNKGDITIHVDTPGGSTKSGKSMIDVMNYIVSDISTINTGMAASMGSLLLASGTKGKRYSLPSSKVMIHQVSAGTSGNIQDMRISIEEAEKENNSLFEILGEKCNKSPEEVMRDATRDKWLTAEEAKSYGLIDDIILNKGVK